MRRLCICMALVLLSLPLMSGCSNGKDKKEKSVIDQQTDRAAQQAVKMIKTPLDKAKVAAEKQEEYDKQVTKQVKK